MHRTDARHPEFGEYVTSGDKARDVYAKITSIHGVYAPDEWLFDWISQNSGGGHVRLQRSTLTGYVYLANITVPPDQRGHGIGDAVLRALCVWADRRGWVITLTPDSGTTKAATTRLARWYRRHGFVYNRGKNKDYLTREAMYRVPRTGTE